MDDEAFFEKFEKVYGVNALFLRTTYYHFNDDNCYSQLSFMVLGVKYGIMNRDVATEIAGMNATPETADFNAILEMVDIEVNVTIVLLIII